MQTFMYFESIDYTKMMGKGGILLIFFVLGQSSVNETLATQARGFELKPQRPYENTKHGGTISPRIGVAETGGFLGLAVQPFSVIRKL